jgi:hypothetical protein
MRYEFCLNEPSLVFTLTIRNTMSRSISVEAYTHLKTSLRTCQTYARKDSGWTEFHDSSGAIVAHFDDPQTDSASVVVQNVGFHPSSWTSSAAELDVADSGVSRWISSHVPLKRRLYLQQQRGSTLAAFEYTKELLPGDSLTIVQIISSCRRTESMELGRRLVSSWRRETEANDRYVKQKAFEESTVITGDPWVDRSAEWARGLLASNAHYIDGSIVPMPCPAEYNFFFTHDVLMTNLAAVNCDLPRVKRDLAYISSHAKDGIIPHAYYWRDDGFKTELCTPDNWNHLWFILVTASYLRHSMDDSTCNAIYPLVTKSLEEILQQKKEDNLMYAFRPDWWDIGRNEGPRAYITILTIRALREYVYLSAALGKTSPKMIEYERTALAMQSALQNTLWDEHARYLVNFNGGVKDHHYYMGSLLAAAYGLLSPTNGRQLVESASRELVDPRIGVRNVFPVDFHTDTVRSFFKFVGNEAGDPYLYANGGVWPHNNAWYTLALQATDRADEALQFFKTTMTVDGVARSPKGQPAMFEYRFSDPASPEFGRIDKPSFLWAGGFYLYTLYNLLGVQDKEWNVSFSGSVPGSFNSVRFDLAFGSKKSVTLQGKGNVLQGFIVDGIDVPSRVLPLNIAGSAHWNVILGKLKGPILEQLNAILYSARFNHADQKLVIELSSFDGHDVSAKVDVLREAKSVLLDGKQVPDVAVERQVDGTVSLLIHFHGLSNKQKLEISF